MAGKVAWAAAAGAAVTAAPSSDGGNGGFGGGGGGGFSSGGQGGFGGGGGSSGDTVTDAGGFGGGNSGFYRQADRGGGGGAGMGGAIFVMNGGSLTLGGSTEVRGNSAVAGKSGGGVAQDGSAFGSGIFMQGTSSRLALAPGAGATQTVADTIADQTGSGGAGGNAGSIGLTKSGAGRLVLSGTNTYSGGTTVTGGTLSISTDQNLGAASSLLTLDGGALQTTAALTTARAMHHGKCRRRLSDRRQPDRDGNWLARVGVRVKGDIATSAGRLQPYARVNLYRASGGNDSTRFDQSGRQHAHRQQHRQHLHRTGR